jgi:uncharacterized lipoprotein YddW (UPF0748 family)
MITRLLPLFSALALGLLPCVAAAAGFQGAWITSVHNINWPSRPGLSAKAQQAEAVKLLDAARAAGLDAVLLQVRPESDALYRSALEPWSRYLTGTQGQPPGYDPLEFFLREARRRGLEVHAWINPYRAAANASQSRTRNHISRKFPQHAHRIGNVLWMDPGAAEVRAHVVEVVRDLVRRYDLAGVHMDDYFYPYPSKGKLPVFPDAATYGAYRKKGGRLDKADWRRANVNMLVRDLGEVVRKERPGAVFGVSPFGIYTKGMPSDVKAGVDQYNQLFADPVLWMNKGWVDYLAPQLYWPDGGDQSFTSLLRWWRHPRVNRRGVPILPGIAVARMTSHGWRASEIKRQLDVEKSTGPRGGSGFILWNIGAIAKDTKGVLGVVRTR